MSSNPYSPPATTSTPNETNYPLDDELARRFTRFAAVMVDGFLMMAIVLPIQYATGYLQRAFEQQVGLIEQLVMSLLGMAVVLVLNGYLLFTRGQTIGKFLTKIQIVDNETNMLLPFLRVYVYRYLWLLPLLLVIIAIPGAVDDLLVNLVSFVDGLLIFRADRRCLHDHIAGSKVVMYQEDRQRVL